MSEHGAPPPEEPSGVFTFATVDKQDIRNQAYDVADAKLQKEQHDMLNRKGLVRKGLGKLHNWGRESATRSALRQKHMREAEKAMISAQNLHSGEDPSGDGQKDMDAILDRINAEHIRTAEGEHFVTLKEAKPALERDDPDPEQHDFMDLHNIKMPERASRKLSREAQMAAEQARVHLRDKVQAYIRDYIDGASQDVLDAAIEDIKTTVKAATPDTIAAFKVDELKALAEKIKTGTEEKLKEETEARITKEIESQLADKINARMSQEMASRNAELETSVASETQTRLDKEKKEKEAKGKGKEDKKPEKLTQEDLDKLYGSIEESVRKELQAKFEQEISDKLRSELVSDIESQVRSDRLVQTEAEVREQKHKEVLDQMLRKIKFQEAKVRAGVRTELQRNAAEKGLDWIEERHPGLIVPTKVAAFALTAYLIATKGFVGTTGRVANTFLPGAMGAAISGVHEARTFKSERRQLERESAKGEQISEGGKTRRQELAEVMYEKQNAKDLIDQIEGLTQKTPEELTATEIRQLMEIVAGIDARDRIGIERKVDLISFSGSSNVETERFHLAQWRARAITYIDRGQAGLTTDEREQIGIGSRTTAEAVERLSKRNINDVLKKGMEVQDKAYKRLRNKRVGKAMIKGFLIGLGAGIVFQEGAGFVRGDYQGVIDGALAGGKATAGDQTWLRNLLDASGAWDGPNLTTPGNINLEEPPETSAPTPPGQASGAPNPSNPGGGGSQEFDTSREHFNNHVYDGETHQEILHHGVKTNISNGFRLVHEVQGSNTGPLTLKDTYGNVVVPDLELGENGFSITSLEALEAKGIELSGGGEDPLNIVVPESLWPQNAPNVDPGQAPGSAPGNDLEMPDTTTPIIPDMTETPKSVDVNPRVGNYFPPVSAPFITGRRELEPKPPGRAFGANRGDSQSPPEVPPLPTPPVAPAAPEATPATPPAPEPAPAPAEAPPADDGEVVDGEAVPEAPTPSPEPEPVEPEPTVDSEAETIETPAELNPARGAEVARGPKRLTPEDLSSLQHEIAGAKNLNSMLDLLKSYEAKGYVGFNWDPTKKSTVKMGGNLINSSESRTFINELQHALNEVEKEATVEKFNGYADKFRTAHSVERFQELVDALVSEGLATIETPADPEGPLDYRVMIENSKIEKPDRGNLRGAINKAQTRIIKLTAERGSRP